MRIRYGSLALLGVMTLTLGTMAFTLAADEPKASPAEIESANKTGETVKTIHLADELAAHGRAQKSALQLLTAATLLQRTGVVPSKSKPTVELPKGMAASDEDDKEAPPASMKAEAGKLLDEAQAFAKGNDAILKAIAMARDNKLEEISGTRGGNPRSYSRQIRQGVTHTYSVSMVRGSACSASVSGNGRNSFTITATGAGGRRHGSYSGASPYVNWNAGGQARWTISVTNNGPGSARYSLNHN